MVEETGTIVGDLRARRANVTSTGAPRAPRTASFGRAAAILMAAFIASRLTGLVRDIVVTAQFGTSREMDAYLAGIRIPDFLFQIVAGGAVASAFIPVFKSYLANGDEHGIDDGWQLVSTLFNLAIVVLGPLIVLLIAFANYVVPLLVPNYEPEYQALAADLARILLISPLFFTIGCFTTSVLNSFQRFFLAALAPMCYNLGIIFGAAVLAHWYGIHGLALGATFGSALFLIVQVPGLVQVGLRYRPILAIHHPGVRRVGILMLPRVLGLAVAQVNFVVVLFLASGTPGAVTALNYAWLLTMLPLGVFGMAVGTAVFPSLAEQTARQQIDEMVSTAVRALRMVLFLTVPASAGLVVLATPLVRVLFERGRFVEASTEMVAGALQLYAIGLVGMATLEIVTRAFYALQDTRTPVAVAFTTMLLNLGLAVTLLPAIGYLGLALATALASLTEAAILVALGTRRLPGLLSRELIRTALRSVASAGVMGIVLAGVVALGTPLLESSFVERVVLLAVAVGLGAAIYVAISWLLGSREIVILIRTRSV